MKIALIVLGVIAVVSVVIEVLGRIVGRREAARAAKMTAEEHRAEQETAYKSHAYGSGVMVITGGECTHARPDGVHIMPISRLKP